MKRRETKQDAQRRLISAINNDAVDSNGDTPACPCRKPARYGTRADPDCRHCFGVGYLSREQADAMLLPDPAKEAVPGAQLLAERAALSKRVEELEQKLQEVRALLGMKP